MSLSAKNGRIAVAVVVAAMVFASCADLNTNQMEGLGGALIHFPATLLDSTATTSFAPASFEVKSQPADITGYLDYLYRPVRNTYNPLANSAIEFVDNLLESVEVNIFAEPIIMAALDEAGSWASKNGAETEAYRVSKSGLTYSVEIWKIVDGRWLKTLDLDFTKNGDDFSGTAIAASDAVGLSERPVYQVDFNTADALGAVIEVRAVNIEPVDATADNVPRKLWLKAWQNEIGFFVAANIHYVQIDIESASPYYDEFMTELGGDPLTTDVQASYIYQGAVDTVTGYGGVSLALVPAAETGTASIFTTYSIGEIYKRAIAEWIRTNPIIGTPTGDMALIDVLNYYLALVSAPTVTTSSNNDDLFAALETVKTSLDASGDPSGDLDAVLFVVKVVNPGYYDSTSGFVGTAALNTPSWSGSVPAFSGDVEVSASEIADIGFTVGMPAPAAPDF